MFNDMPLTAAEFTGPVDREETVTLSYLTSSAAVAAYLRLMTRFYARTIADGATYLVRDIDLFLTAKYGLFKLYREIITKIVTPSTSLLFLCAKKIAKKIVKNRIEITLKTKIKHRARIIGRPEPIIPLPFFRIAKHRVGLTNFFEVLLSLFVPGVSVGMMLKGKFPVCLLDLLVCRVPGNAEEFVVINVFSSH
jgi:hypothetical protein